MAGDEAGKVSRQTLECPGYQSKACEFYPVDQVPPVKVLK